MDHVVPLPAVVAEDVDVRVRVALNRTLTVLTLH